MAHPPLKNARQYIEYARQLAISESYTKAFDMYLIAFEQLPALKEYHEIEFRVVINNMNNVLVAANKIDDIFENFSLAIALYPENVYLLNEVGKYFYKIGYYCSAWIQFQRALKFDAGFVNAEKNLNSVKNLLVERWHYRMLNDIIRNETYRAAIRDTVTQNDSVLDVGCGTGLLSLYSNECNPKKIIACDSSEIMANIANPILNENGVDRFLVLNKKSTVLQDTDIGGKCSVLVTELFDAGLFGEHILTTLYHAWNNLLAKNARVLPASAEFFVIGVESSELINKYQLSNASKDLLKINSNVHVLLYDETYDSEDIEFYKSLKYITEPASVMSIDFNDINSIEDKLKNPEPYIVQIVVTHSGKIDAYIGWFDLKLTEDRKLTTDPRSTRKASAWQNAVFFDNLPRTVREDERFVCKFSLQEDKVTLLPDCNTTIIRVSAAVVRFLNDVEYLKKITSCLGLTCVYLGQMTEMAEMTIIDLCPFPFFGFQMLKRGIKSLVCFARTDFDKCFMNNIFVANGIDVSKVSYVIGDHWSLDHSFGDEKYHAIFCNILEMGGDIDLRYKEIATYLKQTKLHPGGLYLPSKLSLIAQIAKSDFLDTNNRLYDKNVNNIKISQHLNRYQVSQNFCIDYSLLEYTPLSDPVDLGDCMDMASDVINVTIKKTDDANCIICWYNIELLESIKEISTKRSNSFVYGTAFLADPHIQMKQGDIANILHCVDSDGSFKLMLDMESN